MIHFVDYAWIPITIGLTLIVLTVLLDDAFFGLWNKLRKK